MSLLSKYAWFAAVFLEDYNIYAWLYNNWEERTIINAWHVVVYVPQWNVSIQKMKVIIYGFLYILEAQRPMENPMAVIQEKVATTQRWCHFPSHQIIIAVTSGDTLNRNVTYMSTFGITLSEIYFHTILPIRSIHWSIAVCLLCANCLEVLCCS